MNTDKTKTPSIFQFLLKVLQGALIGLGAVLPGISGGVLSVVFGVYKTIMELLANPFRNFKTHIPKLLPYIIGSLIGFMGIANLLSYFLEKYPAPSVCLFAGLIIGMLPSLWREAGEKGRPKGSFAAMLLAFCAVLMLLTVLNASSLEIVPNFLWFLFCGFCLALSVIAPGMSFSTLLMPLGLYTPFVDGIGHLDSAVLLPGGAGALITVICLAKLVDSLFENHYSLAFHAILGIVTAATLMIIPFESFRASNHSCSVNLFCMAAGIASALILDHFNSKVKVEK